MSTLGVNGIGNGVEAKRSHDNEVHMAGVNTLADALKDRDEDYERVKQYASKLEQAVLVLLEEIEKFADVTLTKEKLREIGLKV